MRVLHLIEHYLPPSQVWLYLLLKKTQEHVEHHIGTRVIIDNAFTSDGLTIKEAQGGAYRLALKTIAGHALQRYRQHFLLMAKNMFKPSEAREWITYCRRQEINLIHVHFGPHACEHLAWLSRCSIPFVVSFYGYDYEKAPFQKPHLRAAYHHLFQQAVAIICEGTHGQKILADQYACPVEKLFWVPLGIEITDWPPPRLHPKPPGQLWLLQVADFTPKKGQLDTIRAAFAAKQKVPNLSLTLVGRARDQVYYEACQELIRQLKAEDWITVQSFVPLGALRDLFIRHDAFIHPSCYTQDRDCEGGAPTILFYAQCLGLPIISTLHCDIPGVVKEGISGRLVAEGDIPAISERIQEMAWCTPNDWQKWQEQTIVWGQEVADLNRGAQALQQLYTSLVAECTKGQG